jgi:signal transduction histidine kinase
MRGEKTLDVRDNAEGELSILKNEIYKATVALTEQSGSLAKDKRELANSLTDISHQLKTPLTAIGVMADLMDDDDLLPQKRQEFLENVRVSINRMEWLVLSLLKLARLDADAAELKLEPVLLPALIERALSPLLIPAELREQIVSVSGQDAPVVCDLEWTAEALGNIIKNALENTPLGGHIGITYGKNPLYTFISVHDGGPGIGQADLPHLFKRFYRGKNANRQSAGIGLSLSLAVMLRQNGDIEVTNDHGGVFMLKFYH